MSVPFFIVGASRSGTTMLRLILNAHPRLAVPHELKYLNTVAGRTDIKRWDAVQPEAEYRALVRDFLHRRCHVFEGVGVDRLERAIFDDQERTLRAPYRIAAEMWAHYHGKERWGEKTPRNLYYADVLVDMFPEAKFIYVARDPRAVVASMNRIEYFSGDTALNALNVRRATTEGYALLRDAVPEAQWTTVRYEDLVSDPERWTRALCEFLEEPFEPMMLSFHHRAAEFMDPIIRTPAVTRPVSANHTAKWSRTLAPSDVATVESICTDAMATWGYSPTGERLPLQERLSTTWKRAYWAWKGWRHRDVRGYSIHYPPWLRARTLWRSLSYNSAVR